MDDEKDWYKSTVLDTRIINNSEGEQIKQIYVGFRIYDEEGSKDDEDGRKFFGWSNKYDSWYSVTETTVQRLHSCHLQYRKVESQNRKYDNNKLCSEEKEDILYNNSIPVAYGAMRANFFAKSHIIQDALDMFG